MSSPVVLDASAVLALLHREPGCPIVVERIQYGSIMSSVNLAEVISKQLELAIPADETVTMLQLAGVQIYDFDTNAAIQVGQLRKITQSFGLSLGDRACIALAQYLQYPVLTADKAWIQINADVEIIIIR